MMPNMIKETIAKRLQDFRKMMGLSQAALAKKTMAITKSSIEKILFILLIKEIFMTKIKALFKIKKII